LTNVQIKLTELICTKNTGCTTMWLDVSTPDPRPDDGRPKNFTAVQVFGQIQFTWIGLFFDDL